MAKLTKKDFVDKLMETEAFASKKAAENAINAFSDVISSEVKAGNEVVFGKLGTFTTKQREARKGFNPRTKEAIDIPAKTVPTFKTSATFKAELDD